MKIDNFHASLKDNLLSNHPEIIGPSFSDLFPPKKWKRPQKIDFFKKGTAYIRTIKSLLLFCRSTLGFLLAGLGNKLMSGSKVIREKSRGEGSLIEQDTIENVSEPRFFF